MSRRALFLSHSASRNGASLVLLHFLRWLTRQGGWELDVLVGDSGPLLASYGTLGRARAWRRLGASLVPPQTPGHNLASRMDAMALRWRVRATEYDLVYANTAASWPLVEALQLENVPLLWHIHELSHGLRLSIPQAQAERLFARVTRFVAASKAVSAVLAEEYRVAPGRIDVINEFFEPSEVGGDAGARRASVLQELGWPATALVVGACGAPSWRKGTDVFLLAARRLASLLPGRDVRFLWVGGERSDQQTLQFDYDARALGIEHLCARVPTTANVQQYYDSMDVFALPSREDPFPLVMMEAAAAGKPVVCFAGSGGGPEFVGRDGGAVVQYLDVEAFVAALAGFLTNEGERQRAGEAAQTRANTGFRTNVLAPRLLGAMASCLDAGASSRAAGRLTPKIT